MTKDITTLVAQAKRFGVSLDWAKDLEALAAKVHDRPFVPTPDPKENRPSTDMSDGLDETCLV